MKNFKKYTFLFVAVATLLTALMVSQTAHARTAHEKFDKTYNLHSVADGPVFLVATVNVTPEDFPPIEPKTAYTSKKMGVTFNVVDVRVFDLRPHRTDGHAPFKHFYTPFTPTNAATPKPEHALYHYPAKTVLRLPRAYIS